jgi:formate hydrogenlyase transcriptional activator
MEQPSLTEDAALRAIVEGVEAETGDRFFSSLVQHLAAALDVQYAFVSEFSEDKKRFRTLAVWGQGNFLPNFEIPLAGTPCEAVLNGQISHHPAHLQTLFPEDKGLVTWRAESYCGVPLLDSDGICVGHLAIVDDKPMLDGPRGIAIMRIFAARARAEIERLRVEQALRESERRYRDLYDEAPVAYFSVGTDTRIRQANRQAVELFGYPLDQLLGRVAFELLADTPNGRPKAERIFKRFLAGQEILNEELEWRRADGTELWTRASVRPIFDAQGQVEATRSMHVDITDRKRAEEALRLSEERLARILDSAMDGIVTFDDAHQIEIFNDAAEKIFGCSAPQAIGQSFDRFLTSGFRHALETALSAFARGDHTSPYVWAPGGLTARRTDGQEFPIEATISHVEVAGRTLYTLIVRDINERTRTEETLRHLHLQNAYLQEEIRSVHNFDEIVGQSRTFRDALEKIRLVASTDSSVLILGETGTGKELIARAVHSNSQRKDRPLIKVNCAALPTGLIESELFGHEKGAFTGATDKRIGRFELAHGGTIFLDEIGEMPLEVQVKLLRVLQEHEFERVGGNKTIKVDVRVIAATNRDLTKAIAEGKFRQDLYYRLNVFPIHLPPLRERPEDISLLVHYFVARYAAKIGRQISRVPKEALQRLVAYAWPGNVRELENIIERAVILSPGPELVVATGVLPATSVLVPTNGGPQGSMPETLPPPLSLEQAERNHIVSVLKQTKWRIDGPQGAAQILHLHPSTLRSRIKKLGIQRSSEEFS